MFVCDDCHDDRCPRSFLENLMQSYGRCEDCGKTAACADCQGYRGLPSRMVIKEEPDLLDS